VAPPPDGGKTWSNWGQAFAAACARQAEAERLSYRSRDGEKILFQDLVAHHYLPLIADAAPNTRKNTASHLGDGTGVPVRGHYSRRAARSQLLFAFGALPIGAIGPNEVQQWISQMAVDGYDHATMRAKRSLLKTILQGAVDQGWLSHNVVERARLPRAVSVLWSGCPPWCCPTAPSRPRRRRSCFSNWPVSRPLPARRPLPRVLPRCSVGRRAVLPVRGALLPVGRSFPTAPDERAALTRTSTPGRRHHDAGWTTRTCVPGSCRSGRSSALFADDNDPRAMTRPSAPRPRHHVSGATPLEYLGDRCRVDRSVRRRDERAG
jgi:hypothetical protein